MIDMFGAMPPVGLSRIHGDPEEPVPYDSVHHMLRELPAEAVDAFAAAGPGSGSSLLMAEIRHLGGALGRIDQGHGALARLDAPYLLFGVGMVMGPDSVVDLGTQLPALGGALAPWHAERVYLNFEEQPTGAERIFDGETLRRLRAIRASVDPAGLMLSNHPVTAGE